MLSAQTYNTLTCVAPKWPLRFAAAPDVQPLGEGQTAEVLAFLAERPLYNVIMAGMIRDNGLTGALNRGTFYACRNLRGALEGVALIGHATLLDARTDRALQALAHTAQNCGNTHLIMGEQDRIEEFWRCYADRGQSMRLACRELLFEMTSASEPSQPLPGLRLATLDDLNLVAPVQAEMAFRESGVNPLEKDPQGFRQRCARRIQQGRTWVLIENDQLIFKAEIQAETPEMSYLEGIYVNSELRGQGYGSRCLTQLCGILLTQAKAVCLLVDERNEAAHKFYQQLGFKLRDCYDTIFLRQRDC